MSEDNRTIAQLKWIIFVLLGILAAAGIGVLTYKRLAARRLRLANLNLKVRELELTAIRAQMNPHFLFNALNSIQNLVQQTKLDEAHEYLARFASMIRAVLKNSSSEEITLYEELQMIQEYVELEQLRFTFDFNLSVDPDIDTYSIFLPPLLLQPIVENAILHGLAPKKGYRKLVINIEISEFLCIIIEDNGIGRKASSSLGKNGTGNGIQFSEERLKILAGRSGGKSSFSIVDLMNEKEEPLGTRVKICFPIDE